MKTLIAIAATAALLLPGAALAQTSGQPQQNQNNSQNQNSQNSQSNPNSMNSQSQSNSGQEQTIEGCVTRQETDYYITPINGNRVRLHSYEDMSGAANHMARVHGHYGTGATTSQNSAYNGNSSYNAPNQSGTSNATTSQNPAYNGNAASNTGSQNGTSGATTSQNPAYNGNSSSNMSNPNGQSQSGQQPSNAGAATGGQSGQSGNSQTSSVNGQNGNSANGGDFLVTRVETISSSCPANGQGAGNQPHQ